jgi:photosystem II stability/assembly factor-like uncharacterized protein
MKTRQLSVKDGDVLLMIGTTKGAFLARSNTSRKSWDVGGPYFPGSAIYAMAFDDRSGRRRLWASVSNMHFGSVLSSSDDFGRKWTNPEAANVKFPEGTKDALKSIWQISLGSADEPDTMFCGVEPAALFESTDAGATWSLSRGLFENPHRGRWEPGGGGLCLHTVLPHPTDRRRMTVAISTGGVYRTDDGGASWSARNKGIKAEFLPDKDPEFGQCVHKVARAGGTPDRLYAQNHWGLYRSDDGGDNWNDIAANIPSTFGFGLATHPTDPDTAWIVPLESDGFRVTPEGKLRVYRTRNGGKKWEALTKGLPQDGAFETVLRDGLAADALDPAGVYFGTRSGKVFGSADEGKSWRVVHASLPPVTCVKVAVVPKKQKGKK